MLKIKRSYSDNKKLTIEEALTKCIKGNKIKVNDLWESLTEQGTYIERLI